MYTLKLAVFIILLGCCANAKNVTMDADIAVNEAEGKELVSEINLLLSEPWLPPAVKAEFDAKIEELKNQSILESLRNGSTVRRRRDVSSSSGDITPKSCCTVSIRPIIIRRTKSISKTCTSYFVTYYQAACGFGWWYYCTRRQTHQRPSTCYEIRDDTYYVTRTCPMSNRTCCVGYTLFRGSCFKKEKLIAILSELMKQTHDLTNWAEYYCSNPNTFLGLKHLGCFDDESYHKFYDQNETPVTVPKGNDCLYTCKEKEFRFATVTYNNTCFCGFREMSLTKLNNVTTCHQPCSGNSGRQCFIIGTNNVYLTDFHKEGPSNYEL